MTTIIDHQEQQPQRPQQQQPNQSKLIDLNERSFRLEALKLLLDVQISKKLHEADSNNYVLHPLRHSLIQEMRQQQRTLIIEWRDRKATV